MKAVGIILLPVVVPLLAIVLGLVWVAEWVLGFRYEGFLQGEACGWHKR